MILGGKYDGNTGGKVMARHPRTTSYGEIISKDCAWLDWGVVTGMLEMVHS